MQQLLGRIRPNRLGYWGGIVFSLLGVALLLFEFSPFFAPARRHLIQVNLPGEKKLNLKTPGTYVSLCWTKHMAPETMQTVATMQYTLIDTKTNSSVEVVKASPKDYKIEKRVEQTELFRFTVEGPGSYKLHSTYPEEIHGPLVTVFLEFPDSRFLRIEHLVIAILLLVLGISIWYRQSPSLKRNI